MIEYLIKSGLVLSILLAIYHLWLEKEKMHRFNRFFLLASLVFGLTVPLITLNFQSESIKAIEIPELSTIVAQPIAATTPSAKSALSNQPFDFITFLVVYTAVAFTLLIRFSINLARILLKAARNPKQRTEMGTIVLLKDKVVPHSFLNYTFLSEEDYLKNKVEEQVLMHEFAHINQRHSIDTLLIETLKIIFWFNPVFALYRKAIQLNHEFLADEAVIASINDISAYQYLLLQKASLQTVSLASNLNYSITKLRFQMMKKQTSKTMKMLKGLSLIPLAAILLISFSNQIFAQGTSTTTELKINLDNTAQLSKDAYYSGATMRYKNASGKDEQKKYEELTDTEKSMFPAPVAPTETLMKTWADTKKYLVLFNFDEPKKHISKYKASDFVSYYTSKSQSDNRTIVFLINKDWLENTKKLGGSFLNGENGIMLTPPPPVMPAKN